MEEAYARNHIGQGSEQDGQPAREVDVLDAQIRDHGSVEFEVTLAVPCDVHVQRDASCGGPGHIDSGDLDGHWTQIQLGEVQAGQGPRKHGGEHGLDDLLDHAAGGDVDVGPQLGNEVVEEA